MQDDEELEYEDPAEQRAIAVLDWMADRLGFVGRRFRRFAFGFGFGLLRGFFGLVGFLEAYLFTRPWRALLWAIPAMIIATPFLLALARMPFVNPATHSLRYRKAAIKAYENAEFETAVLHQQKLHQLGVKDELLELNIALKAIDDDPLAKLRLMQQRAPEDRPGLLEAHLWIVSAVGGRSLDLPEDELSRLFRIHLEHALELAPNSQRLRMLRVAMLLEHGDPEAAKEELKKVHPRDVEERIQYTWLTASLGRSEEALEHAADLRSMIEQQRDEHGHLTVEEYLQLVAIMELTEPPSAILQLLEEAREVHPDDSLLRDKSIDYLLAIVPAAEPGTRREIFQQLRELAPFDERVLQLFASDSSALEETSAPRQALDTALTEGRLPLALAHDWADQALAAGRIEYAKRIYAYITTQDPKDALAANNLGWLLFFEEPRDETAGLALAERAVALEAKDPRYRDTRGRMYLKLERWQEAAADLTMAVNGMPRNVETQAALAEALAKLRD